MLFSQICCLREKGRMQASFVSVLLVLVLATSRGVECSDSSGRFSQAVKENEDVLGPWFRRKIGITDRLHPDNDDDKAISIPCGLCTGVVESLIYDLQNGVPLEEVEEAVVGLCAPFLGGEEACAGLIDPQLVMGSIYMLTSM